MKIAIRLISIINCLYALIEDNDGPELYELFQKYRNPRQLQLTQIGIILTLITTAFSFTKNHLLISIFLTNTLAVEFIVVLGYWSLYFINPCLVEIKELLEFGYKPPVLKNLSQHLLPLIFLLYEFMINDCKRKDLLFVVPVSVLFYVISWFSSRNRQGKWQYGILDTESALLRGIIVIEFCILGIICVECMFVLKKRIRKYFL